MITKKLIFMVLSPKIVSISRFFGRPPERTIPQAVNGPRQVPPADPASRPKALFQADPVRPQLKNGDGKEDV
jgi:hypothetical protein